jgi:NAD(P)-dependent dehydrogenase (short-subunit alcohol dehydrogenase family)
MFGDRFQLVHCDLENQSTIEDAATQVQAYLSAQPGARLAGLFNVAGILGTGSPGQPPEKTIRHISREWMSKSLQVNTLGPIMLTQALLPALKQRSAPWSVVCNLSARVGSIKDNRLGGWYSYRLSKAALNQFTKTASIELKRDKCMIISLHPGTTDTELSEPFQRNVKPEQLFPVWYSAMMMLDVVFDLKPTDTGKFYAYDGSEIDW